MLKTFALDPELFACFEHFLILRDKFGIPEGRQIAKFPGKWKAMVREACNLAREAGTLKEIRYKTVVEGFLGKHSERDPRVVQIKSAWNEQQSWIENAQASQSEFDCVLSESLSSQGACLHADDLGDYTNSELFSVRRQRNVKRTVAGLIDCVWPLVRLSSVIRIVEPHFNPVEPRFTKPLVELIDRIHAAGRNLTVELHVLRQGPKGEDFFSESTKRIYRDSLDAELPTGLNLKVFFWAHGSQRLHPRYLLTEFGGIKLDYGWDESNSPDEETPAILLEEPLRAEEFEKYQVGSRAFQMDPKIHILELGG